jgi:hypothetical protein
MSFDMNWLGRVKVGLAIESWTKLLPLDDDGDDYDGITDRQTDNELLKTYFYVFVFMSFDIIVIRWLYWK